jgi:hypothetical protein
LLAGEVAHQLRSALDHVVYQLCLANHIKPTTKTGFPIFKTEKGYLGKAPMQVGDLPKVATDKISAVQPYHRGDDFREDPLWMLQTLNNTDKHRLIPVSLVSGGWLTVLFPNREVPHQVFAIPSELSFEPGAELCRFPLPKRPAIEIDPYLVCMVVFDNLDGHRDIAILPFLNQAADYVEQIVENFAADFVG